MTLRHLAIFIRVCEENGITAAAKKLHMTQPSVSQVIQELESHYQTLLFERLGRRIFITEAGRRLLRYSRNLINLNMQTEQAMRAFNEVYHLRLGASITIGGDFLIDLIQDIINNDPSKEIFSEIHNTSELEKMLLNDTLDLALVEGDIHSEYLVTKPFMGDELVFIISPNHPLANKEITVSDLAELKFFVRETGSGTRELFEQVMHQHNIYYQTGGIYNSMEAIKKAVMSGLGVSVISTEAIKEEIAEGKLLSFNMPNLVFKRQFNIVYHKNKFIPHEMQEVIDRCCSLAQLNNSH